MPGHAKHSQAQEPADMSDGRWRPDCGSRRRQQEEGAYILQEDDEDEVVTLSALAEENEVERINHGRE